MNVCQSLIDSSRLFANHEAIVFEGRSFTYGEIESLSQRAASCLTELGIERQDRVGLVVANVPAFAVWYYACLRLGLIVVSVNTRLTGEEAAFILSDCDAKVLVATEDLLPRISEHLPACVRHVMTVSADASYCAGQLLPECQGTRDCEFEEMEPNEPATILYTSGTTGFPKGATLSHQNIRATVHAFNHLCSMQPDDRLLLAVPLFHCYGQNALLNAGFNVGATIVLQRRFDLHESKRLIAEQQVTRLFGVPTTFQLLMDACEPEELNAVEYCFSAAATLPIQTSQRWLEKFGMPIFEGYGLTETAPFASYNHRLKYVPGSLGTPVDLVEMKVVDENGEVCPPGQPGEIAIRGPNVMLGYWNRPEETAAAVRDGWFYSGDIGQTDERGYFYIVDRVKDMISVGGQKVFPAEVERVLLQHSAVAEAAVVGFADKLIGEKVVAFVVQNSAKATTENELQKHCRQHLATFKVPVSIAFLDALPHNPSGKVLKKELRDRQIALPDSGQLASRPVATEQAQNATAFATTLDEKSKDIPYLLQLLQTTHVANHLTTVISHIQAEVRELVGLETTPNEDASFLDTGMESLTMVELRDRLQSQLGTKIKLSTTIVFDYPTIAELAGGLVSSVVDPKSTSSKALTVAARGETHDMPHDHWKRRIEEMPDQQALDELLRELSE